MKANDQDVFVMYCSGLGRSYQKMDGASVSNKLAVEKRFGWNIFTIPPSVCLLVLSKLSMVNSRYKKADARHRLRVSSISLSWLN